MDEMQLEEKKQKKMDMHDIANLFHSTLFSLERAIQEMNGDSSMLVTSHACKFLDKIEEKKHRKCSPVKTWRMRLKISLN
jgi:hypothetical protein